MVSSLWEWPVEFVQLYLEQMGQLWILGLRLTSICIPRSTEIIVHAWFQNVEL
jgi:hypothetical protein